MRYKKSVKRSKGGVSLTRVETKKKDDTTTMKKDVIKEAEIISGTEFGSYSGADLVHKYLMIDTHFYEGISNLSGHHIETLGDLASKIQDYQYDIWHGLAEKGIDKLAGHIAETYIAEHFQNAGVDVHWPDASNQAGWDLIAQGHEVNVKLIENVDSLATHFSKYPDIPAVIPGDSADIPPDAFHFNHITTKDQIADALHDGHLILVDDSLSHADVMHQTSDATDILTGSARLVKAHIPWITLALSGWREANLLLDSKTNMQTAIKNIGLDVAGTTGGAWIGGKAGALLGAKIGTAFSPGIGTAIGGGIGAILGAIGGAISGRKLSTSIKEDDFKTANALLLKEKATLQDITKKEIARASELYDQTKKEKQAELAAIASISKDEVTYHIEQLKKWRVDKEKLSLEEGLALIKEAISDLGKYDCFKTREKKY